MKNYIFIVLAAALVAIGTLIAPEGHGLTFFMSLAIAVYSFYWLAEDWEKQGGFHVSIVVSLAAIVGIIWLVEATYVAYIAMAVSILYFYVRVDETHKARHFPVLLISYVMLIAFYAMSLFVKLDFKEQERRDKAIPFVVVVESVDKEDFFLTATEETQGYKTFFVRPFRELRNILPGDCLEVKAVDSVIFELKRIPTSVKDKTQINP